MEVTLRDRRALVTGAGRPPFAASAMVVKFHQSNHLPAAIAAGLAVPWGSSKGDGDLRGHHLVWPRDMVEAAGGLLAAGVRAEVRGADFCVDVADDDRGEVHDGPRDPSVAETAPPPGASA